MILVVNLKFCCRLAKFRFYNKSLIVLFLATCLSLSACEKTNKNTTETAVSERASQLSLQSFEGPVMGSSYHIKAALPPKLLAQKDQLATSIQTLLDSIENTMSTYRPQSELSRFNTAPIDTWLPMSDEMITVVSKAITMGKQSQDAYDITVGPLVNLWGFGPDIHQDKVPSQAEINEALQKVGTDKLVIDAPNKRWKKTSPVYVDLSSIDQGFAADKVVGFLKQQGVEHAMVEIAGEIRAIGKKSATEPWRIAIESPTLESRTVKRIIHVDNVAIATSGDYRNYFEKDGKRYSHIIDPHSGYPIAHALASVTVAAKEDIDADVYATMLMVLGPDKGLQFAKEKGLAVFMIVRGDHGFEERFTDSFRQYLESK